MLTKEKTKRGDKRGEGCVTLASVAPTPKISTRRAGFGYLTIALSSVVVYVYTLKIGFVWDDYLFIQQQLAAVKEFDFFEGLKKFVYFRPTVTLFSLLDYTLWHRNPFGYHVTNLLFHTINALLVALFSRRILMDLSLRREDALFGASLLAGVLFAVHPIHTESVNWIEGRTDLICTTFFLLSMVSYMEFRRRRSLGALFACGVFGIFAMAAKEPAVMLPAVIVAYEFTFAEKRKPLLGFVTTAVVLCAVVLYARRHIVLELMVPFLKQEGSLRELLWLGVLSYGYYLKKVVVPFPLNFFIGEFPETLPFFAFSILSLGALLLVVLFFRKRAPVLVFMILWWLLTVLPHEVILFGGSATAPVAERYLYLPSVAFCVALGCLLWDGINSRRWRWGLAVVIVGAFSIGTFHRTWLWTYRVHTSGSNPQASRIAAMWSVLDRSSCGSWGMVIAWRSTMQ